MLRNRNLEAFEEAFNVVPEDIADNVLVLPTYLLGEDDYSGIKRQRAFSTRKLEAAIEQYDDPNRIGLALHRQIVYALEEHWGESIEVKTKIDFELQVPTKSGYTVESYGYLYRRSKLIAESV